MRLFIYRRSRAGTPPRFGGVTARIEETAKTKPPRMLFQGGFYRLGSLAVMERQRNASQVHPFVGQFYSFISGKSLSSSRNSSFTEKIKALTYQYLVVIKSFLAIDFLSSSFNFDLEKHV